MPEAGFEIEATAYGIVRQKISDRSAGNLMAPPSRGFARAQLNRILMLVGKHRERQWWPGVTTVSARKDLRGHVERPFFPAVSR